MRLAVERTLIWAASTNQWTCWSSANHEVTTTHTAALNWKNLEKPLRPVLPQFFRTANWPTVLWGRLEVGRGGWVQFFHVFFFLKHRHTRSNLGRSWTGTLSSLWFAGKKLKDRTVYTMCEMFFFCFSLKAQWLFCVWFDFWNTFVFSPDRTLIISENRKCGEGLPEGQQKNTIYSKKPTFPHHKRKKQHRLDKHWQSQTLFKPKKKNNTSQTFLTKPTTHWLQKLQFSVLKGGKQVNWQTDHVVFEKGCYTDTSLRTKWTAEIQSQQD